MFDVGFGMNWRAGPHFLNAIGHLATKFGQTVISLLTGKFTQTGLFY